MSFPWRTPAQIREQKDAEEFARLMAFRLQIQLGLAKIGVKDE